MLAYIFRPVDHLTPFNSSLQLGAILSEQMTKNKFQTCRLHPFSIILSRIYQDKKDSHIIRIFPIASNLCIIGIQLQKCFVYHNEKNIPRYCVSLCFAFALTCAPSFKMSARNNVHRFAE